MYQLKRFRLRRRGIFLRNQGFIRNEIELEWDVQMELLEWKKKRHHMVLQVEEPWQVGKTYEMRKFAYLHYEQVVYVNMAWDEFGFEDLLSERDFMNRYCQKAGMDGFVDDESMILIIDEVQESKYVLLIRTIIRQK